MLVRVENGTRKSRPDRHRFPAKPTVNRSRWKNRKTGKKRENKRERERIRLGCFPDRIRGSHFHTGNSRGKFPDLCSTIIN
jgi:hypothetical protein